MDLLSILATVILAATIATVVIGIAAYAAFKLRDKRRPRAANLAAAGEQVAQEPIFFTRFIPESRSQPAREAIE